MPRFIKSFTLKGNCKINQNDGLIKCSADGFTSDSMPLNKHACGLYPPSLSTGYLNADANFHVTLTSEMMISSSLKSLSSAIPTALTSTPMASDSILVLSSSSTSVSSGSPQSISTADDNTCQSLSLKCKMTMNQFKSIKMQEIINKGSISNDGQSSEGNKDNELDDSNEYTNDVHLDLRIINTFNIGHEFEGEGFIDGNEHDKFTIKGSYIKNGSAYMFEACIKVPEDAQTEAISNYSSPPISLEHNPLGIPNVLLSPRKRKRRMAEIDNSEEQNSDMVIDHENEEFISNIIDDSEEDDEDDDTLENLSRKKARKWRRIFERQQLGLSNLAPTEFERLKLNIPNPINIDISGNSNANNEIKINWEIGWNNNTVFEHFYNFECIVSFIQIPSHLDVELLDVSNIICSQSEAFPRSYEKVYQLNKNDMKFCIDDQSGLYSKVQKYEDVFDCKLAPGDYIVCVWVRPDQATINRSTSLGKIPLQKVIRAATLPEKKKILIREAAVAPRKVNAYMLSETSCAVLIDFAWEAPGRMFELRMEKYDVSSESWSIVKACDANANESSKITHTCNANCELCVPRIQITSRPYTMARKIVITNLPKAPKIRFGVVSIDAFAFLDPVVAAKYALITLGNSTETLYSNSLSAVSTIQDESVLCTICQEPVHLPQDQLTKPYRKIEDHELEDEPIRDKLCASGPDACGHIFHAICLHGWTMRGKQTCPNCCCKFSHEVMHKDKSKAVCIPI